MLVDIFLDAHPGTAIETSKAFGLWPWLLQGLEGPLVLFVKDASSLYWQDAQNCRLSIEHKPHRPLRTLTPGISDGGNGVSPL